MYVHAKKIVLTVSCMIVEPVMQLSFHESPHYRDTVGTSLRVAQQVNYEEHLSHQMVKIFS